MHRLLLGWGNRLHKLRWFVVVAWIVCILLGGVAFGKLTPLLSGGGWDVPDLHSLKSKELITQQFDGLSAEEQRVLEAASVAGSTCAVAAGLAHAVEAVEDCCAGLAQRGQFLRASGLETWLDGTVTERYAWQHTVYQEAIYARVPVGRRLHLHRHIGLRQEAGYGAQASVHAAELALHFERGRISLLCATCGH